MNKASFELELTTLCAETASLADTQHFVAGVTRRLQSRKKRRLWVLTALVAIGGAISLKALLAGGLFAQLLRFFKLLFSVTGDFRFYWAVLLLLSLSSVPLLLIRSAED